MNLQQDVVSWTFVYLLLLIAVAVTAAVARLIYGAWCSR